MARWMLVTTLVLAPSMLTGCCGGRLPMNMVNDIDAYEAALENQAPAVASPAPQKVASKKNPLRR